MTRADTRPTGEAPDPGRDRWRATLKAKAVAAAAEQMSATAGRIAAGDTSPAAFDPPEATSSPSPLGACGSSSVSFESTRDWKIAPSAALICREESRSRPIGFSSTIRASSWARPASASAAATRMKRLGEIAR